MVFIYIYIYIYIYISGKSDKATVLSNYTQKNVHTIFKGCQCETVFHRLITLIEEECRRIEIQR